MKRIFSINTIIIKSFDEIFSRFFEFYVTQNPDVQSGNILEHCNLGFVYPVTF